MNINFIVRLRKIAFERANEQRQADRLNDALSQPTPDIKDSHSKLCDSDSSMWRLIVTMSVCARGYIWLKGNMLEN